MLLHSLPWEDPGAALHAGLVGFAVGYPVEDKHNLKARQAPGFALEVQVQNIE